jgi:putative serine/threonine protein kinase
MCERLNGQPICDFLSSASREEAKWAIRELLCQCFTMDRLGINKDEMTHPNRHIIIHQQTISFPRKDPRLVCTFIDFEKCSFTSKPKNITQICQVSVY